MGQWLTKCLSLEGHIVLLQSADAIWIIPLFMWFHTPFVCLRFGHAALYSNILSDIDCNSDFVIDPIEVNRHLANIKLHKAPGPDGIPNWYLTDFSQLLSHPLAAIFNASLREGFFRPIWKSAYVVAIPKVHPPTSIQYNLRLISLLQTRPTLKWKPIRWRPSRSTTHTSIAVLHKWIDILDKRRSVRCAVFIDYRKAFDIITILFSVNWRSTISPTACLSGLDLICHSIANVLGSDTYFPYGKHFEAVCPRGPD